LREQLVVDRHLAKLVLDDGNLELALRLQQVVEEGGLARAEEAGENGDGKLAVCRFVPESPSECEWPWLWQCSSIGGAAAFDAPGMSARMTALASAVPSISATPAWGGSTPSREGLITSETRAPPAPAARSATCASLVRSRIVASAGTDTASGSGGSQPVRPGTFNTSIETFIGGRLQSGDFFCTLDGLYFKNSFVDGCHKNGMAVECSLLPLGHISD